MSSRGLGRYLAAIARTIHPARAVFEACVTVVFAIPFLAGFLLTRSAPLILYLLYPVLFLVSHFVWFRLPSVERRVRWVLLWLTLTIVAALGAGFLFWSYREAGLRGESFPPSGLFAIPHWVSPNIDVPFPTVAGFFIVPSAAGAALYCLVLALFLRRYRALRSRQHQGRLPTAGRGE